MTSSARKIPEDMFRADPAKCIACGKCVADCPAGIIRMEGRLAVVRPEDHERCILCQHCLAVCPTAAASVSGLDPADSPPVAFVDAAALALHMRSRRSVRNFAPGAVDDTLLDSLLAAAAYAPTGVNIRSRRFTVVRDQAVMAEFRDRCARLLVGGGDRLPPDAVWLAEGAQEWLDGGSDMIFRDVPHLVVVTVGPDAATPVADALIALSYFELVAAANNVATVWCGMVEAILKIFPEARRLLGIPEDHTIGYAMLFGPQGLHYPRTAQYKPEDVVVLDKLGG